MELLGLAGRIILSLAAVLGLMWLLARASRKPLTGRAQGALTVLARQQLSRGSSVAVVKVADRALVVGITETQVSLLGEADLAAVNAALEPAETVSRTPVTLVDTEGTEGIAATGAVEPAPAARAGAVAGSALSPATWKQAVEALRERTARRA
jgi:flagellar protein FliO/FliZ